MPERLTLEEQVIAALRRITRAIDLHSRLLLQRHGLTAPQLAAFQTTQKMQPISVGALAREIHLSQGTVTGILSRLENRGYLDEAVVPTDEGPFAEELPGAISEYPAEDPNRHAQGEA